VKGSETQPVLWLASALPAEFRHDIEAFHGVRQECCESQMVVLRRLRLQLQCYIRLQHCTEHGKGFQQRCSFLKCSRTPA